MFKTTVSPEDAPDKPTYLELDFVKGDCVAINGKMKPSDILRELNKIGGENGIGRVDIVENRFVGMKSRGVYETPSGTILSSPTAIWKQLRWIRSYALARFPYTKVCGTYLQRFLVCVEREALQAFIDKSQSA
ncbi:MAG: hypothetical protein ACLUKN_11375 [Bacilli bacterium]